MRKNLLFLVMILFIGLHAFSQGNTTVTGTVKDEANEPIPFATITETGTNNGTASDAQGVFSINIKAGSTLTISATGYVATVFTPENGKVNAVLRRDVAELSEIVVTALGITREKRSLGYATQAVKGEQLVEAANSNFATALQGKVSGVEITPSSGMPGASTMITIRGARSFTGNNAPLYVIDGMPISSNADISTGNSVTGADIANRAIDIDPNDIASIDVLKGQAASALYGIRASNGVIVITTKSGRGGAMNKPQISFNSSLGLDDLSRYPNVQTTYAQGSNGAYRPTASTSYGPKIVDLPNDPVYGGNTVNVNTNRDGLHQGQYYVPQRFDAGLDPWVTPKVYNNIKDFFQIGSAFTNSIGVSNATKNGSYSFSLGSTNQKGIVPKTGMNKYNARISAESKLSDHFTSDFQGFFTNSNIDKAPSANDGVVATVFPAPPSYDLKGIPSHKKGDNFAPVGYRGGSFVNPYWGTDNNKFNEKTNRFFGSTSINYSTDLSAKTDLKIKYQIGGDAYTTNYRDLWSFGSPSRNSSVTEYSFTNTTLNSLLTATLNWDINSDLKFSALVGNEIVNTATKFVSAFGQDFAFAGWNHIDNTGTKDATETSRRERTFGTFANLSLSWQKMLYLTLTGRHDRISTMPRENRDFFYPSGSLGFVFTELEGLNKGKLLNYGKLRFSVAQVGQAGTYYPNFYEVPVYGGGFYSITPILYPIGGINAYIPSTTVYDPKLKPQNTTSYEIGADFSLWDNRVDLNYTYSRQDVKDQIFGVPLSGSTGASSFITNGGKIHTNSHEVNLDVKILRDGEVNWSIGANFSKIDNYVDALAPGVESIFLGGFVTPQVRAGIGDKFPVIYGTTYERDDQGRVVVDDRGFPIAGAPGVIGRVSPDFILGANTRLSYKMFTLTAVSEWKSGGQMYGGTTGLLGLYGISKASAEARDRNSVIFEGAVTQNGDKNTIAVTGNNIQTYYSTINNIDESSIINSSFVKLRELALRVQLIKKSNLGLSMNFFARNILLWTNAPILDPESSQGNTNMAGAFERFTLPTTKTFGVGVNLQF
jgi:TonB-linked SusC/RagA family outer membrane protein